MICAIPLPQTISYFDAKIWKLNKNSVKKLTITFTLDLEATGDTTLVNMEPSENKSFILDCSWKKILCVSEWLLSAAGARNIRVPSGCTDSCRRAMNRSPSEGELKWIIFSAWCVHYFLCIGTQQQPTLHIIRAMVFVLAHLASINHLVRKLFRLISPHFEDVHTNAAHHIGSEWDGNDWRTSYCAIQIRFHSVPQMHG